MTPAVNCVYGQVMDVASTTIVAAEACAYYPIAFPGDEAAGGVPGEERGQGLRFVRGTEAYVFGVLPQRQSARNVFLIERL